MTSEFKKIKNNEDTHYVLETATVGATSTGVVATATGKKREDSILAQEKKETPKPRNFVAKNAKMSGAGQHKDKKKAEKQGDVKHKKPLAEQGVAEGSLNEFAPDGFDGGDDDEGFSPEIAKMAQEDGFTKGVSLADGVTLARAITINYWHSQHGGMYKQYFAKGFKAGRMNKIKHDNKRYNLNLKLMKDGSIRHGEQGVAEDHADQQRKIVKKNGKPVGEVGIDSESSPGNGQWYMKCYSNGIDNAGYDSMEEALEELKHCIKQGVAEGLNEMDKSAPQPGRDGKVSHSTYGSRDKKGSDYFKGKEAPGKSITKKEMEKYALDILKKQGVAEGFNGEYDDEAGMAHTNLLTSARAVMGLLKTIDDKDNLPEWVQEKIAKAEMMLVGVWDYLQSQKEQGIDPQQDANEAYGRYDRRDAYQRDYDSSVSGMDRSNNHRDDERHDLDPSDWYIVKDGKMYKTSVYPRQEQEAIARGYSRTREEAKSKADNVAEGERTMSRAAKGNEKYGKDGMKALAKAGREGASEKKLDVIRDKHDNYNEGLRDPKDNPCWKDYKPVGTKKKGGKTVPNCVPKESVDPYFESLKARVEELAKK